MALEHMQLDELLELTSQRRAAPAAGSSAAWTLAIAAALAGKSARLSDRQIPDARGLAEEADALRAEALGLAQKDADAVDAMINAPGQNPPDDALQLPRRIHELASRVEELGQRVSTHGNPRLYPDAAAAQLLARAACDTAGILIESNG